MPTNAEKPGGGIKRVRRIPAKSLEETGATVSMPVRPTPAPRTAAPVVEVFVPTAALPRRRWWIGRRLNKDITVFLRQLIMLLDAGTPILKTLASLSQRSESAKMRFLISDIAQYVEMGNPLWQAFERHSDHFDMVFVNLIKASEASGTLITVLQRMVIYRERREILWSRVRGALTYPFILLLACLGAVWFLGTKIIPEFKDMFSKFEVKIDWRNQLFMDTTESIGRHWYVGILVIAALVAVYKIWFVRSPARRLWADRFWLHVPILGSILRKNAIVEFTRTLALLLKSGLSMMSTLGLVQNTIHNRAIAQAIQAMRDSVERGAGLEQPLREYPHLIPAVVADMMVTGEESGRLDNISEQIANIYEEEVNIQIATIGETLQPILTIFFGILVILLVLSVFQPLVGLVSGQTGGGAYN